MAESSNDRLRRLLTLVPWLAAHSGVSKVEAAQHFGLTLTQLEADLSLITVTGPGLYGGQMVDLYFDDETITVYDAQGLLEPVHLTSDESAALILGLQALQQLPDMDPGIVASLIGKLGGEDAAPGVEVRIPASPLVSTITEALAAGHALRITYVHPLRDDATERVVTPIRVVTRDGVDYLHGWCHTAEAQRTFRLDRMTRCEAVAAPAIPVPEDRPDTPQQMARIEVAPTHEYLLEHVPANVRSRGQLIEADVRYSDERWLIQWLLECGPHVRCVEPAHVVAGVTSSARAGLAGYAALH